MNGENGFANVSRRLGELHQANAVACDYAKTLLLLRSLKAGEISLDDVQMTDDGWRLVRVFTDDTTSVTVSQNDLPTMDVSLDSQPS